MAETNVADPAAPGQPDAAAPAADGAQIQTRTDTVLFAGKYETPEALEAGLSEIRGELGLDALPVGTTMIGDTGIFTDIAAAEQAYADYRKMLATRTPAPTTPATPAPEGAPQITPAPETPADPPTIETVIKQAGLDEAVLREQWAANDTLTDEQYAAFAKVSPAYAKPLVDQTIRGMQSEAALLQVEQTRIRTEAHGVVGGEAQLKGLMDWAGVNLAPERIDNLNERLADPVLYQGALTEMMAEHAQAVGAGRTTPLVQGEGPSSAVTGLGESATTDELRTLLDAAQQGDEAARRKLAATPDEVLARLGA